MALTAAASITARSLNASPHEERTYVLGPFSQAAAAAGGFQVNGAVDIAGIFFDRDVIIESIRGRLTTVSAAGTLTVEIAPSGTAIGSGTAITAAEGLTTANGAVADTWFQIPLLTTVAPLARAGSVLNFAFSAAPTNLANLVLVVKTRTYNERTTDGGTKQAVDYAI